MNSQFWVALVVVLVVGLTGLYVGQKIPQQSSAQMAVMMTLANPSSDAEKIANAMSAAPADISRDATILDWPQGSSTEMRLLQQGTNDWTCLPDMPMDPTNDPICADKTGMEWFGAYMAGKTPHITENGIAYMLQGGSTADNDDPMAQTPPAGKDWTHEPPHVMVFSPKAPDAKVYGKEMTGGPWVMWAGTPYAHLMVPVEAMAVAK